MTHSKNPPPNSHVMGSIEHLYGEKADQYIAACQEIEHLRSALKPFAQEATEYNDEYRVDWQLADDNELVGSQFVDLTFGDFRRAHAALAAKDSPQDHVVGSNPYHREPSEDAREAALQAAADANGGYINGKTKQIVIAALSAFGGPTGEAHRHAVALRQCSLFAADVGEHIVKAMTDAADFLDRISTPAPRDGA